MHWRLAGMSLAAVTLAWLIASALRSRRARGPVAVWGRLAAWAAALTLVRDEALRSLGARDHLWTDGATAIAVLAAAGLVFALVIAERFSARDLDLHRPRRLGRDLFFGIGLGASLAFLLIETGALRAFALSRIWLGPTGVIALIGSWTLAAGLLFDTSTRAIGGRRRDSRSLARGAAVEVVTWLGFAAIGPAPWVGVLALATVSASGAFFLRRTGFWAAFGFRAAILLTVLHAPL